MTLDDCCTIYESLLAIQLLVSKSEQELDADWNLDQFFGCSYIINLPHDHDRLKMVKIELSKVGLKNYMLFRAVDGKKDISPELWRKMYSHWNSRNPQALQDTQLLESQQKSKCGCYMSHYKLLKEVRDHFRQACAEYSDIKVSGSPSDVEKAALQVKKYSSVLILEDDNGFGVVNPDKLTAATHGCGLLLHFSISELPRDWDMLYFMAKSSKPHKQVGRFLYQIDGTLCTNAYAVKYTMYDDLIKQLEKIEDPNLGKVRALDSMISDLHATHNCYAIVPSLAYQHMGYSSTAAEMRHALRQLQLFS